MDTLEMIQGLKRRAHCETVDLCEVCPYDPKLCARSDDRALFLAAAEALERHYTARPPEALGAVISKRLALLRAERQWTYDALVGKMAAVGCGISKSSAKYHELNYNGCGGMRADILCAYADVYGVSADYLLGRTDRRD